MYYIKCSEKTRGLKMAKANKKYKDSLIRHIFNEPGKALQLYNAVTGKNLSADTPVEIKAIKTILSSKLRNDLSFIVEDHLAVFFEYQSTINPNMPLRLFKYVLLFFEEYYSFGESLYRENLVRLPKPEFFMLYSGKKELQTNELKLSDAFLGMEKGETPQMELIVRAIDIGYSKNKDVLKRNADLNGYAYFISQVNYFHEKGMDLENAITTAANVCIKKRILYEVLTNLKDKELNNMVKFEYDEKLALEVARKEGREEGEEKGEEKGEYKMISHMLKNGKTAEAISSFADIPLARVLKVKEKMLVNA
jgi:hypothetical protein